MTEFPCYYGRDGQPITFEQWSALQTEHDKRIASDTVGGVWVSTVWIGLDLAVWLDGGPPSIFETMTFTKVGGPWDCRQWRYATEPEALAGHAAVVEAIRAGAN